MYYIDVVFLMISYYLLRLFVIVREMVDITFIV